VYSKDVCYMSVLNDSQWLGVVRHLLSAIGGVAVYNGVVTEDEAASILGASLALIAAIWSVVIKQKDKV
jgi:hypothetical protein